jgi:hypothetical protein
LSVKVIVIITLKTTPVLIQVVIAAPVVDKISSSTATTTTVITTTAIPSATLTTTSQVNTSSTIPLMHKYDNELVTKLANTASVLLGSFGGNITAVIAALGGKLLAPHINTDVETRHFWQG